MSYVAYVAELWALEPGDNKYEINMCSFAELFARSEASDIIYIRHDWQTWDMKDRKTYTHAHTHIINVDIHYHHYMQKRSHVFFSYIIIIWLIKLLYLKI